MPRTGRAYERPSRVAQVLVIGFSVAVVIMAGWLAMMILFPHDADTMAADQDVQVAAASSPPRVENAAPEPIRFGTAARAATQQPLSPPSPWPFTPYSMGSPPPAAPAPASQALTPQAVATVPATLPSAPAAPSASVPTYTTSAIAAGVPEIDDRGLAADALPPANDIAGETPEAAEVIPLPPPKPRRVASIPAPRPRPRLDGDEPPQERSLLDVLFNNRQR